MQHRKWLCGSLVTVIFLAAFALPAIADDKQATPKKAETPEQAIEFLAAASKTGDLQAALDQIAQPFHDIMLWYILHEETELLLDALDQKFGNEPRKRFTMGVKLDLLAIQKIEILAKDKGNDRRVKIRVRETRKNLHNKGDVITITETTYLAVKDGDSWKLLRPFTALLFVAPEADVKEESSSKKGPDGKEIEVYQFTFKKDLDVLGRNHQAILEKREEMKLPEMLAEAKRAKAIAVKVAADVKAGVYKTRKEANDAYHEALRQAEKKNP